MKQRRGIRSIIIRAGIFLLLGAVVNVAVAWGCVFRGGDWGTIGEMFHGPAELEAAITEALWNRRTGCRFAYQYREVFEGSEVWDVCGARFDCGLPLQALSCQFNYTGQEGNRGTGELLIEANYGVAIGTLPLPLRPLWPGFAINTLFYAAILWLLLALPGALRRWRRIKRGLCPACAYPVGAAPGSSDLCTECGHKLNLTSKIAARQRMGLPPLSAGESPRRPATRARIGSGAHNVKRPRLRKVIATVLVFLLLGAIVNVAVAWALLTLPPGVEWKFYEGEDWVQEIANSHDVHSLTDRFPYLLQAGGQYRVTGSRRLGWTLKQIEFRPSWDKYPDDRTFNRLDRLVCGLPCRSLEYSRAWHSEEDLRTRSTITSQRDVLPYVPLWPGFAINTVFYAAILWLLLALPGALRRWRRIKRGLCPACAYPVGASDLCTECGNKLDITSKIARERMGLPPPATPAPGSMEAERKT